jgi:hypothetical protein
MPGERNRRAESGVERPGPSALPADLPIRGGEAGKSSEVCLAGAIRARHDQGLAPAPTQRTPVKVSKTRRAAVSALPA